MCGKTRPKLPQVRKILFSEGLPNGNLLEDNSLIRLLLLGGFLLFLSRMYLRTYKNNTDEIREKNTIICLVSHLMFQLKCCRCLGSLQNPKWSKTLRVLRLAARLPLPESAKCVQFCKYWEDVAIPATWCVC